VLGIVLGVILAVQGHGKEALENLADMNLFKIPAMVLGAGFSFLGGYLAALLAKQAHTTQGIGVGIGSTLLGLGMVLAMGKDLLEPYFIIGILVTLPSALLGSMLAQRQARAKA
jgi:hypothetical protein